MTTEKQNGRVYRTTDIALSGFLIMHGLPFHGARRIGRGHMDFRIVLDDPDGRAPALIAQYPGSEAAKFDAAVRGLKKVLHEIGR